MPYSNVHEVTALPSGLTVPFNVAALEVTPSTDHPLAGLSRAELAVARLVATGLTNREVAGQLYLSVKTVEYHLRNSYMKLDITSRRALIALLR